MPKKDINQTAFDVVRRATGEVVVPSESAKVAAGRKGGQKGGKTRMGQLTDIERIRLAKTAAAKRWKKPAPSGKGAGKTKS
jgi:hypothetical protein